MTERGQNIASAVSYSTSAVTTFFGTLTANELAALGGLTLGVLTFIVNWYYRHKHYQLAKARAEVAEDEHIPS